MITIKTAIKTEYKNKTERITKTSTQLNPTRKRISRNLHYDPP